MGQDLSSQLGSANEPTSSEQNITQKHLAGLDSRWPSREISSEFRLLAQKIGERAASSCQMTGQEVILESLKEGLSTELGEATRCGEKKVVRVFRRYACLASMVMHMEVERNQQHGVRLINSRRRRLPYSSYPTSPEIGQAIAAYIHSVLCERGSEVVGPLNICDPTIEGAPLIQELVFYRMMSKNGMAGGLFNEILFHVYDKNWIASNFFSFVSGLIKELLPCCGVEFKVSNEESLSAVRRAEPFHAVVNNPPWGKDTDGAHALDLASYGPYQGYRDPYIAFVASAIERLEFGGAFGFVVPLQLMRSPSAAGLRKALLAGTKVEYLVPLPKKCFPRATLRTLLVLGRRVEVREKLASTKLVTFKEASRREGRASEMMESTVNLNVGFPGSPWPMYPVESPRLNSDRGAEELNPFAKVFTGLEPYGVGKGSPRQTEDIVEKQVFTYEHPAPGRAPVVRGKSVCRFRVRNPVEYVCMGQWLAYPGKHSEFLNSPRVFVRQICSRNGDLTAAVAPHGIIGRRGVLTVVCEGISPEILAAFFNSRLMQEQVPHLSAGFFKESFNRITAGALRSALVPRALLNGACGSDGEVLRTELHEAVRARGTPSNAEDWALLERLETRISEMIDESVLLSK